MTGLVLLAQIAKKVRSCQKTASNVCPLNSYFFPIPGYTVKIVFMWIMTLCSVVGLTTGP